MRKYAFPLSVFAVIAISVVSATYAYAAVHKNSAKKAIPAVSTLIQALTSRVKEYSEFESAMPSSISSGDQVLLAGELTGAITGIKSSIAALKAATTTLAINQAARQADIGSGNGGVLLTMKMQMLTLAFDASPETHARSSRVTYPTPSATSVVPADVIDQIINLKSLSGAVPLLHEVVADVAASSSVATSTSV